MEEQRKIVALGMSCGMDHMEALNQYISENKMDKNQISDGYHTFGELYEHRITLYIALLKAKSEIMDGMGCDYVYKNDIWRSKVHSDGSVWEGWFLLGIFTEPGKQITYHLPISEWDNCSFATTRAQAPEFDGHTSADVLTRLKQL